MFSDRSWASSRINASYFESPRSPCVSASRIPSVINLIRVSREVLSSNLT